MKLYYMVATYIIGLVLIPTCKSDALHPRRPETEDAFFQLNHHEKATDIKSMEERIQKIKKRRDWEPFDVSSTVVQNILSKSSYSNRPNILLLFADDLGYGDLSVPPFWVPPDNRWPCSEGGILTPHLEKMASNGMVMTNFHSASPVCSPSRVSVMTSLYPWRLDAMNAFELGRDMSQRNGFLPQVPTLVEVLRESGYFTGHSGKWHLGGMREEMRTDRVYKDQCTYGSPNQHGFEEYVSELDGPESPRYTFLNRNSILHSKGHRHLLKDDVPVPIVEKPNGEPTVLSDREAEDAIRMMRHVLNKNKEASLLYGNHSRVAHVSRQPFFIQVWFNAPHGPWEMLQSGLDEYNRNHTKTNAHWLNMHCPHEGNEALKDRMSFKYKTMVTAMDRSIGKLLDALKVLQIEENTIVVFTSDNGPEMGAGSSGPYLEGKRSLLEGGIRVPSIWQWSGKIPAGSHSDQWSATTDLMPTFLDAAGVMKPVGMKIDGVSLLPVILNLNLTSNKHHHQHAHAHSKAVQLKHESEQMNKILNRVFLWHKDTDPYRGDERIQSGAYFQELKLLTSGGRGCIDRLFDMKHDPFEAHNLIRADAVHSCSVNFEHRSVIAVEKMLDSELIKAHCDSRSKHNHNLSIKITHSNSHKGTDTGDLTGSNHCVSKYAQHVMDRVAHMFPRLVAFAKYGSAPHSRYMQNDLHNASCRVPFASDIKLIDFEVPLNCASKFECSIPEY